MQDPTQIGDLIFGYEHECVLGNACQAYNENLAFESPITPM
jgi:hypothetical protein